MNAHNGTREFGAVFSLVMQCRLTARSDEKPVRFSHIEAQT